VAPSLLSDLLSNRVFRDFYDALVAANGLARFRDLLDAAEPAQIVLDEQQSRRSANAAPMAIYILRERSA
jgi:hypothetical protein